MGCVCVRFILGGYGVSSVDEVRLGCWFDCYYFGCLMGMGAELDDDRGWNFGECKGLW